jgi:hypothetical protein
MRQWHGFQRLLSEKAKSSAHLRYFSLFLQPGSPSHRSVFSGRIGSGGNFLTILSTSTITPQSYLDTCANQLFPGLEYPISRQHTTS